MLSSVEKELRALSKQEGYKILALQTLPILRSYTLGHPKGERMKQMLCTVEGVQIEDHIGKLLL